MPSWIKGTARTAFPIVDLECLLLRYLRTELPSGWVRFQKEIVTDGGIFQISAESHDLVHNLVVDEFYFFQIATTEGGNKIIVDVVELNHEQSKIT